MQNFPQVFACFTLLWKFDVPPKVKLFVWRAALKVATRDNLCKRGIHVLNDDFGCAFCFQVDESINHILFVCPRVSYVW